MRNTRLTWLRSSALLALLLALVQAQAMCAQDLTPEQLRALLPGVLNMHLTQPKLDGRLAKRMAKEFTRELDPFHMFYTQPEADARMNLSDEAADRLAEQIARGDLAYFSNWLKEFKEKTLARDEALFKGLPDRREEITTKIPKEEFEKIKPDDWAATEDDRRHRMILRANGYYYLHLEHLTPDDAFKFSLQTLDEARNKWLTVEESGLPSQVMKAVMLSLDPHSEYMDAEDVEQFESSMARSFAGIGVQIRACPLGAQVVEVIAGGPAARSGRFESNDEIIAVDDAPVANQPLSKIVRRIKGEKNSPVRLTLKKFKPAAGAPASEVVALVRDTIDLAEIRVIGKTYPSSVGPIGVINVESFYQGVAGDVADRIRQLNTPQPLAGLVLDLRWNTGGLLKEAVQLAGLFIAEGPIVGERDSSGQCSWHDDPDEHVVFDGPLVVLVNQFSASASEIVTGALKDYGRAVVVGATQTHGKGTVQRVLDLSMVGLPGQIKVTIQQYFLAGGESVQLKGVIPDIQIPGPKLIREALEEGYGTDSAIPWAAIKGRVDDRADVKQYRSVKSRTLSILAQNSALRIAASKEFDIYKEVAADKLPAKTAPDTDPAKVNGPGDVASAPPTTPPAATGQTPAATTAPAAPEGQAASSEKEAPLGGKKADKKDPQADEAVRIVADEAELWIKQKDVAGQTQPQEPEKVSK